MRYPEGPTSTDNLSPGCSRDHRAKHAPGASLRKGTDGALRWISRAGMAHLVAPAEQPLCDDPQAGLLWQALLAADADCGELLEALGSVRHHRRIVHDDELEAAARAQLVRTYRRAHPTVDAEDIDHWVWGDGTPPPRLRSGMAPSWDRPPEPAVDLEGAVG